MADDAPELNQQQLPTPRPSKEDLIQIIPKGYRRRGKKALQDVNLNLTNTNLIILGKRKRRLKDLNNFAVQIYATKLGPEPLSNYLQAFLTKLLSDRASARADKVPQIY